MTGRVLAYAGVMGGAALRAAWSPAFAVYSEGLVYSITRWVAGGRYGVWLCN